MLETVIHWIEQYQGLITWMGVISLLMFLGSLIMLPWLLSLIPADYFAHDSRVPAKWKRTHPFIRISLLLLKNLIGYIILLAGVVMLVLPGQGLLSILVALMLLDYPGKFRFERWVISRPSLLNLVNRMRIKFNKPELIL